MRNEIKHLETLLIKSSVSYKIELDFIIRIIKNIKIKINNIRNGNATKITRK